MLRGDSPSNANPPQNLEGCLSGTRQCWTGGLTAKDLNWSLLLELTADQTVRPQGGETLGGGQGLG